MKKIFGFLLMALIIGITTTSCKSKQKVVEISGADIPATETQQPTQPVVVNQVESNERTIDESFKLADGEMNNAAFNRRYHVVVGSFGIHDNAKRLQSTLKSEGNDAIIVVNDRGMYRVLIASYDDYSQARVHIDQISNRFPDAWVLRQK